MPKNWSLLIRTAEHIIDHPESWDQSWFFQECGTVACFAGWTTLLEGYKPHPNYDTIIELTEAQAIKLDGEHFGSIWNELRTCAQDLAAHLLGLTWAEGRELFYGGNDLTDILVKLDEWAFADNVALSEKLYKKMDEILDAAAAKDGF